MLLGIYVTLFITAFSFFILGSLFRSDNTLIISWVSTLLFLVLALSSFDIRTQFCDLPIQANATVSNIEHQCYTTRFTDAALGYFMYAMTFISLILAMYWSVSRSSDALAAAAP